MTRWLIGMLLLATALPFAYAQSTSKQFTEIEYDDAGRVKAIRTAVEAAGPHAETMTPAIVRRGPAVWVEVRGGSLRAATIETDHVGLVVSAVTATASAVTFRLQADESVPLGEHRLVFTTALGSSEIAFTVYPRLPVLAVEPDPTVLTAGETVTVSIRVDSADVIPHTFDLIGTGVASVTPARLSLPAGATFVGTATVQAAANGVGMLRVETDEIADVLVPVFATPRWSPAAGMKFYSWPLGVQVGEIPAAELIARGPFTSLLGVVMPGAPVGTPATISIASTVLGVSIGAVANRVQPDYVVRGGGPATIEVSGVGLGAVQGVNVAPNAGLTAALQSVDADGQRVVLDLEAEAGTALGMRELELVAAGGAKIPFATRALANVRIVDPQPEIESVAPLFLVRGTTTVVSVRGVRLAGTTALRLTPSDGVLVGSSPTVETDGTRLSVNMSVAADAPLGERTLSLLSAAGETSTVPAANNRIMVVAAAPGRVTPVLSPLLGVNVGSAGPGASQSVFQTAAPVGLLVGGGFSHLEPAVKAIDSQFTLHVHGHGLTATNALSFEPATGITVNSVTASDDGTQVSAEVSIAPEAPRGLRRVRLASASGAIAPVTPDAALFRVTERWPEIESVSPVVVVPGSGAVTLTLRGRNFSDVTGLRLQPVEGASLSAPVIAADGVRLTATLNVAADAPLGARTLVLDSPTGSSDATPSAANTLIFARGLSGTYSPLLSPRLGVQLGEAGEGGALDIGLTSALLGVQVGDPPVSAPVSYRLTAARLGLALGPVAKSVSPRYLPAGRTAELRLDGAGLTAVTAVEFLPPAGIVASGALQVAPDGSSATLPLAVAADAAQTERRVVLRSPAGEVPFALPEQAFVRVVGNEPRIDSIAPIQATSGQTLTLTVRGVNLFGASAVTATPSQGLIFGIDPVVSPDGTVVTVTLTIAAEAPSGPRVIRVVASGGTTTGEALAANTFTVVTGQ
jgi:hypothetical protein